MSYPLADQIVCLDADNDRIWVLNSVAARMLEYSKEGLKQDVIAQRIATEYDVDVATVLVDLGCFAQTLEDHDALVQEELVGYTPITDFQPSRVLGQTYTQTYHLPGYKLIIESEVDGLHQLLGEIFPLSECVGLAVENLTLHIYQDDNRYPIAFSGKTLDTGFTIEDTAVKCLREINGLIARQHELTIIFHASAVAKNNAGILFPALGGSGKTTLAAYLMHCGYAFLNDDAVPMLAQSGELLPVPVSLSIKSGSWPVLNEFFPKLSQLKQYGGNDRQMKYLAPEDGQIQLEPVACKLVIIPDYQQNILQAKLKQASVVDVFSHIIRSGCIVERPINPIALEALVAWLDSMPCYVISYSTLPDAEGLISQLLDSVIET